MTSIKKVRRTANRRLGELTKNKPKNKSDKTISMEEIQKFRDALINEFSFAARAEFQNQPAIIRDLMAGSNAIEELIEGFKEGVDSEIKKYLDGTMQPITSMEALQQGIADAMANFKLATATDEPMPTMPAEVPKQEQPRRDITAEVTGRDYTLRQKSTGLGGFADYGKRVLYGAVGFGLDERAERQIAQKEKENYFIQREQMLDPTASTKELRARFREQQRVQKEMVANEQELKTLRESGYSEEQIAKMGVFSKRGLLEQRAVSADPTRLSQVSASAKEEIAAEQEKIQEDMLKEQEDQTALLSEIRDGILTLFGDKDNNPLVPETSATPDVDIDIDLPSRAKRLPKKPGMWSRAARVGGSIARGAANVAGTVARGVATAASAPITLGALAIGGVAYAGYRTMKEKEELQNLEARAEEAKKTGNIDALSKEEWNRLQTLSSSNDNGSMDPEAALIESARTTPSKPAATLAAKTATAAEAKTQPIVVQAPPPVVMPSQSPQIVMPPFTTGIRNTESSISSYMLSKYK